MEYKKERASKTRAVSFIEVGPSSEDTDTNVNEEGKPNNVPVNLPGSSSEECQFQARGGSKSSDDKNLEAADGLFHCSQCDYASRWRQSVHSHEKTHFPQEREFHCKSCDHSATTKSDLTKHSKTHYDSKPFKCSTCSKEFRRNCHLKEHQKSHTKERPFKCQYCEYTSGYKQSVRDHEKLHTGERPFQCNFCPKSFKSKLGCQTHLRVHTGERPFKCQLCDKTYSQKTHLSQHLKSHGDEKPFKCEQCPYAGKHRSGLKIHMKTHASEKPFSCRYCDYTSSQRAYVKKHEFTHSSERPEKCSSCSKSFATKAHLREHVRRMHTHLNPKFKCKKCPRMIESRRGLERHMKTHEDKPEKRNLERKCLQCKFTCTRLSELTAHLEHEHEGVGLHRCILCPYVSLNNRTLHSHKKFCHNPKLLECKFCDFSSPYKYSLKTHEKIHLL